jgi:hypothetical protein
MAIMKEKLEIPIGKCDCINSHYKAVILMAIDSVMSRLSRDINEIESDARKRDTFDHVLKNCINERTDLDTTRKKLADIPECPD